MKKVIFEKFKKESLTTIELSKLKGGDGGYKPDSLQREVSQPATPQSPSGTQQPAAPQVREDSVAHN